MHLIEWNLVIIDMCNQSTIKHGNSKGNAIKNLNSKKKIGIANKENSNYRNNMIILRDIFGFSSKENISSITFEMD